MHNLIGFLTSHYGLACLTTGGIFFFFALLNFINAMRYYFR